MTRSAVVQILRLKCSEASVLSSQGLDERLHWSERAALWGHLLVCRSCRRFDRQLHVIRRRLREHNQIEPAGEPLSPEARDRILRTLRDEADNPGPNASA